LLIVVTVSHDSAKRCKCQRPIWHWIDYAEIAIDNFVRKCLRVNHLAIACYTSPKDNTFAKTKNALIRRLGFVPQPNLRENGEGIAKMETYFLGNMP